MLSKSEIKDIQSLSHKKYRSALNLFIAEGPKVVGELCALMPASLKMIYATEEWLREQRPSIRQLPHTQITEIELTRISQLQTPNQVLAVFHQRHSSLPIAEGIILYLDRIRDPGNLGTIIRTADWFGISKIVCSPECAELYNPKLVQATMGSLGRVDVSYDEAGNWLEGIVTNIWAATLDGHSFPEDRKEGVLVIGNESQGVSDSILQRATHRVTIPRKGEAESLNAAVAAGILMSQLSQ